MFDRRQLLQKVDAGSAKEDAHLIGKAGAQALLAGAPRRLKVSRAYERLERSRSAPRASIILRANCRVVHNRLKMLKLGLHPTIECGTLESKVLRRAVPGVLRKPKIEPGAR